MAGNSKNNVKGFKIPAEEEKEIRKKIKSVPDFKKEIESTVFQKHFLSFKNSLRREQLI